MEQLTVYSGAWSLTGAEGSGAGGGWEEEMGGNGGGERKGEEGCAVAPPPPSNWVNFYSWNEVIPRASRGS